MIRVHHSSSRLLAGANQLVPLIRRINVRRRSLSIDSNDHGGIPVGAVRIASNHIRPFRDLIRVTLARRERGRGVSLAFRAIERLPALDAPVGAGAPPNGGPPLLLVHLPTEAATALDDGNADLTAFLASCGGEYLPGRRRPRSHRVATRRRSHASIALAKMEQPATALGWKETPIHTPVEQTFTFAEFFAGIGGFRLGLEPLGGRCVFANEIDPYAASIYRRHFASRRTQQPQEEEECPLIEADILDLCAHADIPRDIDVLTAGFPCQPFSTRGAQAGLGDARGQLYRELVRMLRGARPKSFVMENVVGLVSMGQPWGGSLSKEKGNPGATFLHMLEAFEGCGYRVGWRILNSRHWVPQQRERVFIVGTRKDLDCDEFSWDWYDELLNGGGSRPGAHSDPSVVRDILEPPDDPSTRASELTSEQWNKVRSLHDDYPAGVERSAFNLDAKSPTLISSYRKASNFTTKYVFPEEGDGFQIRRRPRFLTPRECCRIMGFPETFAVPSHDAGGEVAVAHWYSGIGNAVVPQAVTAIGAELIKVLGISTCGTSLQNDSSDRTGNAEQPS